MDKEKQTNSTIKLEDFINIHQSQLAGIGLPEVLYEVC